MTVAELIAILQLYAPGDTVVFRDTEEGVSFDIRDVTHTHVIIDPEFAATTEPATILLGEARKD